MGNMSGSVANMDLLIWYGDWTVFSSGMAGPTQLQVQVMLLKAGSAPRWSVPPCHTDTTVSVIGFWIAGTEATFNPN